MVSSIVLVLALVIGGVVMVRAEVKLMTKLGRDSGVAMTPEQRREARRRMRETRRDYGVSPRVWVAVVLFACAFGYSFILLKQHG